MLTTEELRVSSAFASARGLAVSSQSASRSRRAAGTPAERQAERRYEMFARFASARCTPDPETFGAVTTDSTGRSQPTRSCSTSDPPPMYISPHREPALPRRAQRAAARLPG